MRHCCKFKADDIYFLGDDPIYKMQVLHIGFCPICGKPVAELCKMRFDGEVLHERYAGIKANEILIQLKDKIEYSMQSLNYQRTKQKPTGWKYGDNREHKNGNVYQYAKDFYGNKELIKTIKK